MDPVMYLFLNKGAGMSTGKAAAQASHAAVEAFRLSLQGTSRTNSQLTFDQPLVREWYKGGHYKKIVFELPSDVFLLVAQSYIEARGFRTELIIDEGRTEVEPHTATALGVELVDKDDEHVAATFGSFRLYRDPPPRVVGSTDRPEPFEQTRLQRRFWPWQR